MAQKSWKFFSFLKCLNYFADDGPKGLILSIDCEKLGGNGKWNQNCFSFCLRLTDFHFHFPFALYTSDWHTSTLFRPDWHTFTPAEKSDVSLIHHNQYGLNHCIIINIVRLGIFTQDRKGEPRKGDMLFGCNIAGQYQYFCYSWNYQAGSPITNRQFQMQFMTYKRAT